MGLLQPPDPGQNLDDPISSNYPLTQVADGVISLLGVEHLFVDVW